MGLFLPWLPRAAFQSLSCLMTKPTKWHVCPAKTRISLGIRPVWSESSLSAWRKLGSLATHLVHSEDSRSDWADALADLSLRWAQSHFVGNVMRWLIFSFSRGFQLDEDVRVLVQRFDAETADEDENKSKKFIFLSEEKLLSMNIFTSHVNTISYISYSAAGGSVFVSWLGDSNEYAQHRVLWGTEENYPLIIIKYPPYLRSFYMVECLTLSALDLRVTVWILLEARFFSNQDIALLHRALHVHPSIILIWLKYFWKGCKTPKHPYLFYCYLNLVTRSVYGVCNQGRRKPACAATEAS